MGGLYTVTAFIYMEQKQTEGEAARVGITRRKLAISSLRCGGAFALQSFELSIGGQIVNTLGSIRGYGAISGHPGPIQPGSMAHMTSPDTARVQRWRHEEESR